MTTTIAIRHYDARRDQPRMLGLLRRLLAPGIDARRVLPEWVGWCSGPGLVVGDGYVFYRSFGDKLRVDALLAPRRCEVEVLEAFVDRFGAGRVLASQSESWWRVFRRRSLAWAELGFEPLPIEILTAPLRAGLFRRTASHDDAGVEVRDWTSDAIQPAAELMARSPDPLQHRVPTPVGECRACILESVEAGLGALAVSGGQSVGFVTARASGTIGQLYVDPAAQGQGVGGRLLDRALAQLRAIGNRRAQLTMAIGNEPAWRLYSSRGFVSSSCYSYWYRLPA